MMYPNAFQDALLRTRSTPSITVALDGLLDRQINITKSIRSKASDSQRHLRDFLGSECTRDWTFPRVLSTADSDFLGGSFARHTKVWPLDDIDIYVPLDGQSLLYMSCGQRLPYTVLADNVLLANPLLSGRWTQFQYVSSALLVQEFAKLLRRHYPEETQVVSNGECISIRLTYGQTEDNEGLGYDIVPCFSLKPDDANEIPFYLIPDGNNSWIRTNPRVDIEIAELLHTFHNRLYRKVVKLVKYWNKVRIEGAFPSYYIEFALSNRFLQLRAVNTAILTLCDGLRVAFDALRQAYAGGDQISWIKDAPPIAAPSLKLDQSVCLDAASLSCLRARTYELSGNNHSAINELSGLFGESL